MKKNDYYITTSNATDYILIKASKKEFMYQYKQFDENLSYSMDIEIEEVNKYITREARIFKSKLSDFIVNFITYKIKC